MDKFQQAVEESKKHKTKAAAARALGLSRKTFTGRLEAGLAGVTEKTDPEPTPRADIASKRELKDASYWKKKHDAALEELELSEKRLTIADALGTAKPRKIAKEKPGDADASTAIIVMTDWHAEEDIDPATCNGLNEFTPEICEKRAHTAFRKSLELIEAWRRTWPVDEIYLALLGDFIAGYIHEELQESNHLSPTESLLLCEQLLTDGINFLLKEARVKRIVIPTSYGNHGRTTPKRRIKTGHKNSYEWLMYHHLSRLFAKEPRVEFRIANGYHNIVEIRGHTVRFHHGDDLKYQGGVGGLSVPVNKAVAAWNKSIRSVLDVFGHWHQFLQDWRWVSCGCLCGYNDFSVAIKADYQPPTQTVILMNGKYGKVAALPVFVE
jgi:hypothetical protein